MKREINQSKAECLRQNSFLQLRQNWNIKKNKEQEQLNFPPNRLFSTKNICLLLIINKTFSRCIITFCTMGANNTMKTETKDQKTYWNNTRKFALNVRLRSKRGFTKSLNNCVLNIVFSVGSRKELMPSGCLSNNIIQIHYQTEYRKFDIGPTNISILANLVMMPRFPRNSNGWW